MYCTYVLYSLKDKKLYIGSTSDIKRRFSEHMSGKSKSTSYRRPFKILFCEHFISKKDALRRERYFKTDPGKRCLKIMTRESLKIVEP